MKVNIGKYPRSGAQKIDIRIDRWDTYSIDSTLSHIILPLLLQLRDTKCGVPMEFCDVGGEDYANQDSFDFYKETHLDAFNIGVGHWNDALDKMIWSFEQLVLSDYDSQYHHGKMEIEWKDTGKQIFNPITNQMESTHQIIDKNPGEHWYDADGHNLHEERIQEGLELFGKYYRNLWD